MVNDTFLPCIGRLEFVIYYNVFFGNYLYLYKETPWFVCICYCYQRHKIRTTTIKKYAPQCWQNLKPNRRFSENITKCLGKRKMKKRRRRKDQLCFYIFQRPLLNLYPYPPLFYSYLQFFSLHLPISSFSSSSCHLLSLFKIIVTYQTKFNDFCHFI